MNTQTEQKLIGNTILRDPDTGVLKSGKMSIRIDGDSASVSIENDTTLMVASKRFTTPEQVEALAWILQSIHVVHTTVDLGVDHQTGDNA